MMKTLVIRIDDKREEYAHAVSMLREQEQYNNSLTDDLANALDFGRYAEKRAELAIAHAQACSRRLEEQDNDIERCLEIADRRGLEIMRLRCIIELLLVASATSRQQQPKASPLLRFREDPLMLAQRSDIDELDARSGA